MDRSGVHMKSQMPCTVGDLLDPVLLTLPPIWAQDCLNGCGFITSLEIRLRGAGRWALERFGGAHPEGRVGEQPGSLGSASPAFTAHVAE